MGVLDLLIDCVRNVKVYVIWYDMRYMSLDWAILKYLSDLWKMNNEPLLQGKILNWPMVLNVLHTKGPPSSPWCHDFPGLHNLPSLHLTPLLFPIPTSPPNFQPLVGAMSLPYTHSSLITSFCITNHQHPHPHATSCHVYHICWFTMDALHHHHRPFSL